MFHQVVLTNDPKQVQQYLETHLLRSSDLKITSDNDTIQSYIDVYAYLFYNSLNELFPWYVDRHITGLMVAAARGYLPLIKSKLPLKNIDVKDIDGKTVMDYAKNSWIYQFLSCLMMFEDLTYPLDIIRSTLYYLPYEDLISLRNIPRLAPIISDPKFQDSHPGFPWSDGRAKVYQLSIVDVAKYLLDKDQPLHIINNDEHLNDAYGGEYELIAPQIDLKRFLNQKLAKEKDYDKDFRHRYVSHPSLQYIEHNKAFVKSLTELVLSKFKSIKRGDIIDLLFAYNYGHSNGGKIIFNGLYLEPLDTEWDEDGSVPTSFVTFHPFPIGYFLHAVTHNCLHTFVFDEIKDELRENLQQGPDSRNITYFTYNNIKYYIADDDFDWTWINSDDETGEYIVIDLHQESEIDLENIESFVYGFAD